MVNSALFYKLHIYFNKQVTLWTKKPMEYKQNTEQGKILNDHINEKNQQFRDIQYEAHNYMKMYMNWLYIHNS
jgi:hypothetical protein